MTQNRLLRQQLPGRIRLNDGEQKALAEIGKRLGKHALAEVATIVKPETILAPPISEVLEALIVRLARENRS